MTFSDIQGDNAEEKVSLTHTMKRNLRRSKAHTSRSAMNEKLTIVEQTRETSIHVWRLKSDVTVPNKKLNQDANKFIRISYKKCRSPTKSIFDSKLRPYIHIIQIKRRSQGHIFEAKCCPAYLHFRDNRRTSGSHF